MMTMDECRELRNKLVSEALSKSPGPPEPRPKRKRSVRPPDAKMPPALPEPKKAEESPEG